MHATLRKFWNRFRPAPLTAGRYLAGLFGALAAAGVIPVPAQNVAVPPAPREFRGLWVATVNNIDWPSSRSLDAESQKAELVQILDRAAELKMNAIIFQVRPACDALYKSDIEPWSEYLTGKQGQAPEPEYDPLEFAIAEAHKRGMELHAWFNPYRAGVNVANASFSEKHISRRRPDLVREYGSYYWLDPGEKEVQDYSLSVIQDVVRRYDIDAVHFDDYFYPYAVKDSAGRIIPFPDDASYARYKDSGGTLPLDNWRQENVNLFIQRVSKEIKAIKPTVEFGVSPFGIWRPGYPPGVIGLDSVKELNADSRLWWREGWIDYIVPQLYWKMQAPGHGYDQLLAWWAQENVKGRHLYAGMAAHNLGAKGWTAQDIVDQIAFTRTLQGAFGNVFFNTTAIMKDYAGIVSALASGPYAGYALLPPSPWIDNKKPSTPAIQAIPTRDAGTYKITWRPRGSESVFVWAVYAYVNGSWRFEVVPGNKTAVEFSEEHGAVPTLIAVAAVDRHGNESDHAIARTGAPGELPVDNESPQNALPVLYSQTKAEAENGPGDTDGSVAPTFQ